jgi:hypothetical protein
MDPILILSVLLVGGLGVVFLVRFLVMRSDKWRIEDYLQSIGAVNIEGNVVPFAGGRYSETFDVCFMLNGEPRQNRCRVVWEWLNREVYWRDLL